jgi:thioredoxin 1
MELKDQGNAAYKAGRYADAFKLYSTAMEMKPDITLLLNRMSAAMALRWYSQALTDGKTALRLDPSNSKAIARTANVLLAVSQLAAAEALLATSPSNEGLDASKTLLERLRSAEAKLSVPVEALLAMEPSALFSGSAFAMLDAEVLLEQLINLLKLAPYSEIYLLAFVFGSIGARRFEAAQSVLTAVLSAQRAGEELKLVSDASEGTSFAVSWRDCTFPEPRLTLARIMAFLGNFQLALGTLAALVRDDPDGSTPQASEALHLLKTLKACSSFKDSANELYKAGKYSESVEAYRALLHESSVASVCPAIILSNLAAALLAAGKPEDALRECNASLKLHPMQPKIWARRASCLEKLKPVQNDQLLESLYFAQVLCPEDESLPGRLFSVSNKVDEATAEAIVGHFGSIYPDSDAKASSLLASAAPSKRHKEADVAPCRLQIIDMFATWCGPCKVISPTVDKLALSYPIAQFIKIDGDKCRSTAAELGTRAFPTFIVFADGTEVARMEGADAVSLKNLLTEGLSKLKFPPKARVDHPSTYLVQALQAADMCGTATRIVHAAASFEVP